MTVTQAIERAALESAAQQVLPLVLPTKNPVLIEDAPEGEENIPDTERVPMQKSGVVINVGGGSGNSSSLAQQAQSETQRTKQLIYVFGGLLAALILLIIVLSMMSNKKTA